MTQNGNGKDEGEKMEESVSVSSDPFLMQPSPPLAVEVPDGLPSDAEFRVMDLSGINGGAVLVTGDRLQEAQVARARAVEDAQRRHDEAARARADTRRMGHVLLLAGDEPDIDEEDTIQLAMEPYWRLVHEIPRPEDRWTFFLQDDAEEALKLAFPILEDAQHRGLLKTATLALFGGYRKVSVERFSSVMALTRDQQKQSDMDEAEASKRCEEELEKLLSDSRQAAPASPDRIDENASGFRESDRFPQSVPQDGAGVSDPPGKSGEWDVDDVLGSDPRRDSAPARTDSQHASIRRRLEPAPVAQSVWDEPRREVKETLEKKTSPRLVYAIIALVLAMIGLSIAYLYSDSAVMHTEIRQQDVRNDSQDDYIGAVDTKVSRVVTALVDEKQNVVVLKRERDEMSSLASSFRDAMQDKAREEGQTRMRYEVRFGQLSEEIARLRRELETERARRSPAQPEPTPTPSR